MDEERQIDEILKKYSQMKQDVEQKISQLSKQNDKIKETLSYLDERITSIGDETVKAETAIRTLKGDSAGQSDIYIQEEESDCLKVIFKVDCRTTLDMKIPSSLYLLNLLLEFWRLGQPTNLSAYGIYVLMNVSRFYMDIQVG